jgi:hypothetical protein
MKQRIDPPALVSARVCPGRVITVGFAAVDMAVARRTANDQVSSAAAGVPEISSFHSITSSTRVVSYEATSASLVHGAKFD